MRRGVVRLEACLTNGINLALFAFREGATPRLAAANLLLLEVICTLLDYLTYVKL